MARDHPGEDADVDLEVVLEAMANEDLDGLRDALGDRWWASQLRQPHFRSPDGDRVVNAFGVWKLHNIPASFVETVGPLDQRSISMAGPELLVSGEPWERLTDEEVLAHYAEKDDTGGMGFLLSASGVSTEER